MFKKLLLTLGFALPTLSFAAPVEVSPSSLKQLKPHELGQVVLMFMPPSAGKIEWSTHDDNVAFRWIDGEYLDHGTPDDIKSQRKGLFRGHSNGVVSTFLLNKREYEMPWLVTMYGNKSGKFGVDSVGFHPYFYDLENNDSGVCFGQTHRNCEIKPLKSLERSGISYKKICENQMGDGNFDVIYLLSKQGKKNTYGIWSQSAGSHGIGGEFTLDYASSSKAVCDKYKY